MTTTVHNRRHRSKNRRHGKKEEDDSMMMMMAEEIVEEQFDTSETTTTTTTDGGGGGKKKTDSASTAAASIHATSTFTEKQQPKPGQAVHQQHQNTPASARQLLDRPVHLAQDSLFSSTSGWTDYHGFFNLAFLLLIISNGRVALENLIKYGVLISPLTWLDSFLHALFTYSPTSTTEASTMWWPPRTQPWRTHPHTCILVLSNVSLLLSYVAERLLAARWMGNKAAAVFYSALIPLHVVLPALIVLNQSDEAEAGANPLYSFFALVMIVAQTLKLVSYAHVNYWCRLASQKARKHQQRQRQRSKRQQQQTRDASKESTNTTSSSSNNDGSPLRSAMPPVGTSPSFAADYPSNLTLGNLYYFMLAPTLCYELRFPRTPARRKSFIAKRLVELVAFSFVIMALCQQWVLPLVRNSITPFSAMDVGRMVERVLKLAIPNHLIWLMLFYLVFHSALNLLAELLQFADREFYSDFWNAETVASFWKTWNIPVHRWAVRHVYKPAVRNGWGRLAASVAVFAISAFFHEYLVSVPLRMFRLWACYGMLAQIPLSTVTERWLRGGRAGNVVVWLSLILGQPMAILMYVHDWYLFHHHQLYSYSSPTSGAGGGLNSAGITTTPSPL